MLRYIFLATLIYASASTPVSAQTYRDASGTIVSGVVALPYNFTPLPPGQHNLSPTTSTALAIPSGSRYATICASLATVRYTTDGVTTPTNSVGQPLAAGACMSLSGAQSLNNFRAISSAGVIDVEYFQ